MLSKARGLFLFGILLFQACKQVSTMYGKAVSNDDLELILERTITKRSALRTALQVDYRVANKSNEDIWVCKSNGNYGYPEFESVISKNGKGLLVMIKNFRVLEGVLFEEALLAKFVRIAPGNHRNETLLLKFPMYNHSPLGTDKKVKLSLSELQRLDIEIGYYTRNLKKECDRCYNTSIPEEILVDCLWAAENVQEAILIQVKL